MTIYKKWDVVLVPFPFTDLSSFKKRPALILSPDQYNATGDIVIAFITSNLQGIDKFGDYQLQQWKQAGLPLPSKLRMKFATVSNEIIIKKIGHIDSIDRNGIYQIVQNFFK